MTTPTPEQATQQLQQAATLTQNAAKFSPIWLHFIAICAAGSLYSACAYFAAASGHSVIPVLIVTFTWILIGVTTIPVTARLNPIRRGFGKRWGIMMGIWTALWIITALSQGVFDTGLTTAVALSICFAVVAAIGPTVEIASLNKR